MTPSPALATAELDTSVRVLRWTFSRADQEIVCELSLTADHSVYELRIHPPGNLPETAVERFDDPIAALRRHAVIERLLLDEGWWLERYESRRA